MTYGSNAALFHFFRNCERYYPVDVSVGFEWLGLRPWSQVTIIVLKRDRRVLYLVSRQMFLPWIVHLTPIYHYVAELY